MRKDGNRQLLEVVGQAVADYGHRDQVIIATKVGLGWSQGNVFRDSSRARILKEIEGSYAASRPATSTSTKSNGPTPLLR